MRQSKLRIRLGITLLETVVVIAILGILIAILLPATQAARESARRISCLNNLRQIGLALNNYHAVNFRFPIGCIEWRTFENTTNRQLAWSAFILPHLEQQNIYNELDLGKPYDAPINSKAAASVIQTYVCPSSVRGLRLSDGFGPIDYGGIYGERITSPNTPPKGIMLIDRPIAARNVVDGLSNTLIVGEDASWPDGQWINGRNIFDQAYAINQAPPFENDMRSQHPGGAGGCFADGHVRFLSDAINSYVVAALCTRAGREVVTID